MQISSAPLLTAAKLAELVALGHNRISQIYLHWTAGRYGQLYDDYHCHPVGSQQPDPQFRPDRQPDATAPVQGDLP